MAEAVEHPPSQVDAFPLDLTVHHAFPKGKARAISRFLKKGGILHADVDGGVHFFPYSRNGHENGGGDFIEAFLHGVDAFRKVDRVADMKGEYDGNEALGNVAEGQIGDHLIPVAHVQHPGEASCQGHEVGVGQHGALGWTCGSGSVDHKGHVLGVGLCDQLLEKAGVGRGDSNAEVFQFRKRHEIRIAVVVQALHVDGNDLFQARQSGFDFQDLIRLLLILYYNH